MAWRYCFARKNSRARSNSFSADRVSVPSFFARRTLSSKRFIIAAIVWSRSFVASTSAWATMSRASSNCPSRCARSALSNRACVRSKGAFIASASARMSWICRRAASVSSPCRLRVSSWLLSWSESSAACSTSPASRWPRARTSVSLDPARSTPSKEPRSCSDATNDEASRSLIRAVNSSSVRCAKASALS